MNTDCLFCKIIIGELPSHPVYEDEHTFVFLDIYPKTRGHMLVIPKVHAETLQTLSATDAGHVMTTAQKMVNSAYDRLGATGVNLMQSNGSDAQQEVPHVHMHVIPRYADDQNISFATAYTQDDFQAVLSELSV